MKKLSLILATATAIAILAVPISASARPPQPPAVPLIAAASGAPGTVTLTYVASVTPGSTVNVYRCVGVSCSNFTQIATAQPASGPYTDSTVTAGAYSWYVTATVGGVESTSHSNVASLSISPQPPTGLTAAAN